VRDILSFWRTESEDYIVPKIFPRFREKLKIQKICLTLLVDFQRNSLRVLSSSGSLLEIHNDTATVGDLGTALANWVSSPLVKIHKIPAIK
jgi:hypothetical protein